MNALRVQEMVAEYFGITPAQLVSRKRCKSLNHARAIAIYLVRTALRYSAADTAYAFGDRGPRTILYYERQIAALVKLGRRTAAQVAALTALIDTAPVVALRVELVVHS